MIDLMCSSSNSSSYSSSSSSTSGTDSEADSRLNGLPGLDTIASLQFQGKTVADHPLVQEARQQLLQQRKYSGEAQPVVVVETGSSDFLATMTALRRAHYVSLRVVSDVLDQPESVRGDSQDVYSMRLAGRCVLELIRYYCLRRE
jgi:hypothetical protein